MHVKDGDFGAWHVNNMFREHEFRCEKQTIDAQGKPHRGIVLEAEPYQGKPDVRHSVCLLVPLHYEFSHVWSVEPL